jgi:putative ABC transport system permease protein
MLARLRSFWSAWRDRAAFHRQMSDEMRFHLESRVDDLVRRGSTPDAARRRARLEFGNPVVWQERCRDTRRLGLLDDVVADVRFALRSFRHQKALSAIVVVTLTFGIGVSSGVFTLFSAIGLRPMLDADPETFFRIYAGTTTDRTRGFDRGQSTPEQYVAFRDGLHTVRALSAQGRFTAGLGEGDTSAVGMNLVSCNFFDVYGPPRAALGRLLQAADCETAAPVIVLSSTAWQTRFGANGGIIGQRILVRGVPLTVVGVAPATAATLGSGRAWLPFTLRPALKLGDDPRRMVDGHYSHERWLSVTGRLATGATREQVAAETAIVTAQLDRLHPGQTSGATVTDGAAVHDPLSRGPVLSIIFLVMGALTCLVLIACANVATLLLSRAEARQQDVAVRLSLGAGRTRVLRMLLTETLTLAICAGAASACLAYYLPTLLGTWLLGTRPELSLAPDWRVFAYLGSSVWLAGLAAGLAPSLESLRVDVLDSLKGRRSMLGATVSGSRFRAGLVAVQVALSFVLLVGAALFIVTHYRTLSREVGLETTHVLMPRVVQRVPADANGQPAPALMKTALQVAGMSSIAFADVAPVLDWPKVEISTRAAPSLVVRANAVSPGFFETLSIPIVRGRGLDAADRPCGPAPCHVVVSETFARQVLHAADPVGMTVQMKPAATLEVVGMAADTSVERYATPDPPRMYLPWTDDGRPYQALARFTGSESPVASTVVASLRESFPGASIDAHTLRWPIEAWIDDVGKLEALIVALGGTAAALAALGVFGIVSFTVSRRRHELGIRIALGAARHDIYGTIIGGAIGPVAVGLVAGAGLALLTATVFARVLHELQFAISPRNPSMYADAGLVLLAIVVTALVVPARRAAAINPFVALRYE